MPVIASLATQGVAISQSFRRRNLNKTVSVALGRLPQVADANFAMTSVNADSLKHLFKPSLRALRMQGVAIS